MTWLTTFDKLKERHTRSSCSPVACGRGGVNRQTHWSLTAVYFESRNAPVPTSADGPWRRRRPAQLLVKGCQGRQLREILLGIYMWCVGVCVCLVAGATLWLFDRMHAPLSHACWTAGWLFSLKGPSSNITPHDDRHTV